MNFRTLISDDGKNASIGRTMLWLFTFAILYRFIFKGEDIPFNMVTIYGMLLLYNFGKKLPNINATLTNWISERNEISKTK